MLCSVRWWKNWEMRVTFQFFFLICDYLISTYWFLYACRSVCWRQVSVSLTRHWQPKIGRHNRMLPPCLRQTMSTCWRQTKKSVVWGVKPKDTNPDIASQDNCWSNNGYSRFPQKEFLNTKAQLWRVLINKLVIVTPLINNQLFSGSRVWGSWTTSMAKY